MIKINRILASIYYQFKIIILEMLFGNQEQTVSTLDKKRENFTENIRRNKREEIFSKRRNI